MRKVCCVSTHPAVSSEFFVLDCNIPYSGRDSDSFIWETKKTIYFLNLFVWVCHWRTKTRQSTLSLRMICKHWLSSCDSTNFLTSDLIAYSHPFSKTSDPSPQAKKARSEDGPIPTQRWVCVDQKRPRWVDCISSFAHVVLDSPRSSFRRLHYLRCLQIYQVLQEQQVRQGPRSNGQCLVGRWHMWTRWADSEAAEGTQPLLKLGHGLRGRSWYFFCCQQVGMQSEERHGRTLDYAV